MDACVRGKGGYDLLPFQPKRAKLALSSSAGDAEILIATLLPQTGEHNRFKLPP